MHIIVMGVSGCGKSTFGKNLADKLGINFLDADDLHPADNVQKMSQGVALNDYDREPWLNLVAEKLAANDSVIACSALKKKYRNQILAHVPDVKFIFLNGDKNLIRKRLEKRTQHYMPSSLLDSQFEALEALGVDEPGFTLDIRKSISELIVDASILLKII